MVLTRENENMDITGLIATSAERVDACLTSLIAEKPQESTSLHSAMVDGIRGPAKRARAILVVLSCLQNGGKRETAIKSACAIEMIHAASLILDDMPAMDNAALRRGRTATHLKHDEATAILASVGLLNLAFGTVAEDELLSATQQAGIVRALSRCVGLRGLILGQYMDLNAQRTATQDDIQRIHKHKTGVLFGAAAEIGALVSNNRHANDLRAFGTDIGVAFQTYDDLLDVDGKEEVALKTVGHDGMKPTLVTLNGREQAKSAADAKLQAALLSLSHALPETNLLEGYIIHLKNILLKKLKTHCD